jgi:hypothetical protein
VLVAGGYNAGTLASAELYNPATGVWSATGNLNTARYRHTATLLPDGRVLVAAGYNAGVLASAELYDRGLGFLPAWRPVVSQIPERLLLNQPITMSGTGFRGLSEASSGSTQQSATNYPLVQLRRLDNEQILWLSPGKAWSNTSFSSAPVSSFPAGHVLVTVFVNGIPSQSRFMVVKVGRSMPWMLLLLLY